jgi:hypothetical protein
MQALLPQPPEACEAYLDSHVQEATQEGIVLTALSILLELFGFDVSLVSNSVS